jgi:iron complex transport system ATP-binding protein
MLKVRDLSVELGGHRLLTEVSMELGPGELAILVGPNGAGKTTLLRTCLGLVRPTGGAVELDGRELTSLSARERAARVAWLPQHLPLAEAWPAEELVASARYRFAESHARSLRAAREVLGRLHATELGSRPVTELSGGERQRIALAALLAQEAPLLLLDEPAAHLDPKEQHGIHGLVAELVRQGRGVLSVTHDLNLVEPPRDPDSVRIFGLGAGRLAFEHTLGHPDLPRALGELFGIGLETVQRGRRRFIIPELREPV